MLKPELAERSESEGRWARALPHALALLVFAGAATVVYAPIWRAGADAHLPVRPALAPGATVDLDPAIARGMARWKQISRADVIFEAWLVSRHARTLVTKPHRLFDTAHCFPGERTLTLGIPMITLGLLAAPVFAVTDDPIVTYNVVLVLLTLVGALAMYWLVVSWTRCGPRPGASSQVVPFASRRPVVVVRRPRHLGRVQRHRRGVDGAGRSQPGRSGAAARGLTGSPEVPRSGFQVRFASSQDSRRRGP